MKKRMIAVMLAITLMFAAVTGRLCGLMLGDNAVSAAVQTSKTITVASSRGTIYDCNLVPLTNCQTRTVAVVEPTAAAAAAITEQLGDNASAALKRLKTGSPILVEVPSDFKCADSLKYTVPVRYGEHQLSSHVIGYLDSQSSGVTGIEKAFDDILSDNEPLRVTYQVDAVGRPLSGVKPVVTGKAQADKGIVLTLDSRIQRIVENAASGHISKGAVVVMDSSNGRILASASFPDYSPLAVGDALKASGSPLVNRALSSYNVGSVFKLAVAASALKKGMSILRTDVCTGSVNVNGKIFNCHLHSGHGRIDMTAALAESCNSYFIGLGRQVGADAVYDMCLRMGFNRAYTLTDTLSAPAGTLPKLSELRTQPAALANFSFGQGDLMLTPLHIAVLVSAIANGGMLVTPSIVLGTSESGILNEVSVAKPRRALDENTASVLRQMMIETVANGTGRAAAPENGKAGGKTATAETGWVINGKKIKQAWFAGFYPESGKYSIVILREDGNGGALDCAPVFKLIADALEKLN